MAPLFSKYLAVLLNLLPKKQKEAQSFWWEIVFSSSVSHTVHTTKNKLWLIEVTVRLQQNTVFTYLYREQKESNQSSFILYNIIFRVIQGKLRVPLSWCIEVFIILFCLSWGSSSCLPVLDYSIFVSLIAKSCFCSLCAVTWSALRWWNPRSWGAGVGKSWRAFTSFTPGPLQ